MRARHPLRDISPFAARVSRPDATPFARQSSPIARPGDTLCETKSVAPRDTRRASSEAKGGIVRAIAGLSGRHGGYNLRVGGSPRLGTHEASGVRTRGIRRRGVARRDTFCETKSVGASPGATPRTRPAPIYETNPTIVAQGPVRSRGPAQGRGVGPHRPRERSDLYDCEPSDPRSARKMADERPADPELAFGQRPSFGRVDTSPPARAERRLPPSPVGAGRGSPGPGWFDAIRSRTRGSDARA